jgi:predicted nucleic acid-binding protein
MQEGKKNRILLDADVLIHFAKGKQLIQVLKLYPGNLYVLDKVQEELKHNQTIQNYIDRLGINRINLPTTREVKIEYAMLKSTFGPGESACMATARYCEDIIFSSNTKDIMKYCDEHKIPYKTTLDILYELYEADLLTHQQCDEFIQDVLRQHSKLPFSCFSDYCKAKGKLTNKPIVI